MADQTTLQITGSTVVLRRAVEADLAEIVQLLADDQIGREREGPTGDQAPYRRAFAAIDADPAHLLLVAIAGDQVVATAQLSFLPGLSRQGAWRAQVEAVRVHRDYRSRGLGAALFGWIIEESRRRGCALVQLTTDKTRRDAHRFYDKLGFVASHEGFKLKL